MGYGNMGSLSLGAPLYETFKNESEMNTMESEMNTTQTSKDACDLAREILNLEQCKDEEEVKVEEEVEPFTVREGFSNKAEYGKKLLQLDLFLRALLYGCLFFLLAHPDTRSLLMKFVSKKNLMYVVPVIFALAYYVLNLYI